MKRRSSIALCFLILAGMLPFFCPNTTAQSRSEEVYTVPERQPEFPGGKAALSRYLAENIQVPGMLVRKTYNAGQVSARFIVDELGYVHDVRIRTKPLDKNMPKSMQKRMQTYMSNIISAVERMPRWEPGQVGGKRVAVFYTLPIEVTIQ